MDWRVWCDSSYKTNNFHEENLNRTKWYSEQTNPSYTPTQPVKTSRNASISYRVFSEFLITSIDRRFFVLSFWRNEKSGKYPIKNQCAPRFSYRLSWRAGRICLLQRYLNDKFISIKFNSATTHSVSASLLRTFVLQKKCLFTMNFFRFFS